MKCIIRFGIIFFCIILSNMSYTMEVPSLTSLALDALLEQPSLYTSKKCNREYLRRIIQSVYGWDNDRTAYIQRIVAMGFKDDIDEMAKTIAHELHMIASRHVYLLVQKYPPVLREQIWKYRKS